MRLCWTFFTAAWLLVSSSALATGCGGASTTPSDEVSAEWSAGDDEALAGEGGGAAQGADPEAGPEADADAAE